MLQQKRVEFGESSMSLYEEQLIPHHEGSEKTESSVSVQVKDQGKE